MKIDLTATLIGCASLLVASASANTVTFVTPAGATTSGPVDATATFTTSSAFGGSLTISLTDLLANPGDAAQLLSDLDFTLSSHSTTGIIDPNISRTFGTQRFVNAGGTWSAGPTVFPGWGLNQNFNGGLQLDALGFIGPAQLLIGGPDGISNLYSAANGSISGNGPHNPLLC